MTEMATDFSVFEQVIDRYATAFTVEMISTFDSLIFCDVPQNASGLFAEHKGIDQFPVRKKGKVIGVVEKQSGSKVFPLEVGLLTAAKEPLCQFLPSLKERKYMLVLRGRGIEGIVTRSDLTKLPVRLYGFSLIAHLETLLAQLIEKRFQGDSFKTELDTHTRKSFESELKRLRKEGMDPPPVEALCLDRKCKIVARAYELGKQATDDLAEIKQMRNQVAHIRTYANDQDDVCHFLGRLELARQWITKLQDKLAGQ